MKNRFIFPALVALVCGVSGYVWGQNETSKAYNEAVQNSLDIDNKGVEGAENASTMYAQTTSNASLTPGIVEEALVSAYTTNRKSESNTKLLALHAMQNARLIQQNDEIIALLKAQKK